MMEEKVKLADTYYKINLVPKHFKSDQDIEVYLKGNNLALFLSDIGGAYYVKVHTINHDGFILK
jgi:hypothetical protein